MKIEYFHASKYGNGAKVAEEFSKQMSAKGVTVNIHLLPDLRKALEEAEKILKENKML